MHRHTRTDTHARKTCTRHQCQLRVRVEKTAAATAAVQAPTTIHWAFASDACTSLISAASASAASPMACSCAAIASTASPPPLIGALLVVVVLLLLVVVVVVVLVSMVGVPGVWVASSAAKV